MTTILYIEDDPESMRLVERTLRFAGYQIITAERGLQGIDLARQHLPDLVLTDINLPDLTGLDVASTLRSETRFKGVPIIALTAQGRNTREWEMAFAVGINGYITKPIDVETLPQQIDYYLTGGKDSVDAATLASGQEKYTQTLVSRQEQRIRELENVNRELRHLDHMKDLFIEITAHELRTPLTLLYGYHRLLEEYPAMKSLLPQDPSLAELVKGMGEATVRMQRVVQEIVTVSRIMTDQIDLSVAPVNLRSLIEKAIRSFDAPLSLRRLTFQYNLEDFPPAIRGDGDMLYMVLINLLSNAIKYTPDGGKITLNGSFDSISVKISIKDTGVGIDPVEQTRIFDRFHTTTGDVSRHSTSKTAFQGGGIGLGLTICKGIVEAHGGRLTVESARHDPATLPGSTFHVSLPVNPQITRKVKQV